MKLEIKTTDIKQKILIVAKEKSSLVNLLKTHLEKLGAEVYYSSILPKSLSLFDISFFINEKNLSLIKQELSKKAVFISINQERLARQLVELNLNKSKVIAVNGDLIVDDDIDKILWFSFSNTKEKFLMLSIKKISKLTRNNFAPIYDLKKFLKPKSIVITLFVCFFILQTLFLFPLTASSYFNYLAYTQLKKDRFNQLTDTLKWQRLFINLTKKTYSITQPTLLFLSLAKTTDDLIEINDKICLIFEKILTTQKGTKEALSLFLNKNKTPNERNLLILRLNYLKKDLNDIADNLTIISNKLPTNLPQVSNLKKSIVNNLNLIDELKKIFPFMDEIFAKDVEKNYLLLFANNMELRPGGGFIGSFGILTIKDYTLKEIKVYDVYDADGQLKAHIEPPQAIKDYLKQPHWFLRDSAFSPDFFENYNQAKVFLDRELGLTGFSGGVLLTTSAIENLLDGFDNLYLPDFKEIVNSKNFYLKAQYYAEKNFFPGSIQKKTFLSSIIQQILLNLDTVSIRKLTNAVKKSLDEKQLVVYIENQTLQEVFESLFWSGRVIKPKCLNNNKNCLIDFLMAVDANLGVNKANFFINRLITLKTNFETDGKINHILSVVFKNDSPSEVFPGGSYNNYFQVYLPKTTVMKSITKNGVLIDQDSYNNEIKDDSFLIIGFFFKVLPKTTTEIKISYQLEDAFKKGEGTYQLIVQKQIGSANNDFISEINLPKNYYLLSQNFIPLVKNNQILYNTYLSTDKIFFVELVKE